jgi:lysophospholipase L1-like esterase
MHRHLVMHRVAIFGAAATLGVLVLGRAPAQTPGAPAMPTSELAAPQSPVCAVALDQARFDWPLVRTARLVAARKPVKIVALGSSSTFGAGASTSAASYPSRLADELGRHFPAHEISVLNRGVSGEEASDMLARLETAVIAEQPDLVLWQVGTNSVLRDKAVLPHATLLHEGLTRLKATGADIVLIDPQYAPKVIARPNAEGMVSLIAAAAKSERVCLFHRFALMRRWHENERLPFETFVSPDGLHMNDWSYACVAKWLGAAIAEAVTRPTTTAPVPRAGR